VADEGFPSLGGMASRFVVKSARPLPVLLVRTILARRPCVAHVAAVPSFVVVPVSHGPVLVTPTRLSRRPAEGWAITNRAHFYNRRDDERALSTERHGLSSLCNPRSKLGSTPRLRCRCEFTARRPVAVVAHVA
jgi:hypothetical protein